MLAVDLMLLDVTELMVPHVPPSVCLTVRSQSPTAAHEVVEFVCTPELLELASVKTHLQGPGTACL